MIVKNESVRAFIRDYVSLTPQQERNLAQPDFSPYGVLKDDMIVKKGLPESGVHIMVADRSCESKAFLTNHYHYIVKPYDDVHDLMVLDRFNITVG